MAPKKKATTPKKAVTKKVTTRARVTSKRTGPKKLAPRKKVVKKILKPAASKKTGAKKIINTGFKVLMAQTFKSFPFLWWRIVSVNLLVLFMIVLGFSLSVVLFTIGLSGLEIIEQGTSLSAGLSGGKSSLLWILGSLVVLSAVGLFTIKDTKLSRANMFGLMALLIVSLLYLMNAQDANGGARVLENFVANLRYQNIGSDGQFFLFALFLFVFINWVIVWGVLGKIAHWLVVKSYHKNPKKITSPITAYFTDSWQYFWSYLWLGVLIFWYVAWPVLLTMMGITLLYVAASALGSNMILNMLLGMVGSILLFGVLIYRIVKIMFAQSVLVAANSTAAEAKQKSLDLITGNALFVGSALLLVFGFMFLIRFILAIPQVMIDEGMEVSTTLFWGSILVDLIFSFFIMAPILIAFIYLFMQQLAHKNSIKL